MTLIQWSCQAISDDYAANGPGMDHTRFGHAGPQRYIPVESQKVEVFLEQSFWDDTNPPVGRWKKTWLRPHVNFALDDKDFGYYTTDDTVTFEPESKRRRMSNASKERQRAFKANEGCKKAMQLKVRWHCSRNVSKERKAEFHEKEKDRLNALWAECTKGIDKQVFSK